MFGGLTERGDLDEQLLLEVIREAGSLPITFHRAIDDVEDPIKILKKLVKFTPVKRVLTSGGKSTALEGIKILHEMMKIENLYHGPMIMQFK